MFGKKSKRWRTYEEVATYLLNSMADEFGVDRFEGKQRIHGLQSGTRWEIDARGLSENGTIVLLVECRRYMSSKQSQEQLAALAYRIQDTGAKGGIVVSPLGFQKGAKKVAKAANIVSVILGPDSTPKDFVIQFFDKIKAANTANVAVTESVSIVLRDENGIVIDQRKPK